MTLEGVTKLQKVYFLLFIFLIELKLLYHLIIVDIRNHFCFFYFTQCLIRLAFVSLSNCLCISKLRREVAIGFWLLLVFKRGRLTINDQCILRAHTCAKVMY